MNPSQIKILGLWGGLTFLLAGCEQPPLVRQYTEVHIQEPQKQRAMPMDDIHGFMANMPQDAIHAGLAGNAMPASNDAGEQSAGMNMPMVSSPELEASVDRSPLQWTLPEGWSEEKGSGMRLATLRNAGTETTIISLAGSAGGIASNIARWMQQINIQPLSAAEMTAFLDKQQRLTSSAGLAVLIVDLTHLQNDASDETPSIIAAIIERDQSQIFVKMTGTKEAVLKNREAFLELARSIKPAD